MRPRTPGSRFAAALALALLLASAAGCRPGEDADPRPAAAAEATALLRQAEATAIIARARASATALAAGPATPAPTPARPVVAPTGSPLPTAGPPPRAGATATAAPALPPGATMDAATSAPTAPASLAAAAPPVATTEGVSETVTIDGVSFGAEGVYLVVQYTAPPTIAHGWMQGMIYVRDEATGVVYNEIPVLPVIGPLFAKPLKAGQPVYVMLVNNPPLPAGSRVTVVLGDFTREHIVVQ